MLAGIKYRLRRLECKLSRRYVLPTVGFLLAIFIIAGVLLSTLAGREPIGETLSLRLSRNPSPRAPAVDGIGLSTYADLSRDFLPEGGFDKILFRTEIRARYRGNNAFSLSSADYRPEVYRSPGRPLHCSLALYEGGDVTLDRVESGQLKTVGEGTVRSGRDDVILENIVLPFRPAIRTSTFMARYTDSGMLVESFVLGDDDKVYHNPHSETPGILPGRTPRRLRGLFFFSDQIHAWTERGAVYRYLSDEKRWLMILPSIGAERIQTVTSVPDGRWLAAGDAGFYSAEAGTEKDAAWRAMDAPPDVGGGDWESAVRGNTVYALRNGRLFAYLPSGVTYDEDFHYGSPGIFPSGPDRWLQVHEGSSRSRLMKDPAGELLFLDPQREQWISLRDLRLEGKGLRCPDSPYEVTAETYAGGSLEGAIRQLIPLGRGRLMAISSEAQFLLTATETDGYRKFSDFPAPDAWIPLEEADFLIYGKKETRRIQTGTLITVDFSSDTAYSEPAIGELCIAGLEKRLSPAEYEAIGGPYPFHIAAGTHRYETQTGDIDALTPDHESSELLLIPEKGRSEVTCSIPLDEGILGGERMRFSFRARSGSADQPQRLKLRLSGPFRSFDLQSEKIGRNMRDYRIDFHLPELQTDRDSESLSLGLLWTGAHELYLDDLSLLSREAFDESDIAAELGGQTEGIRPRRLRFPLRKDTLLLPGQKRLSFESLRYRRRLNNLLRYCETEGIEPWIVIPEEWTPEEHAVLFQYLAAEITEPFGRRRLEDGWGQAWMRRLPRIYLEVSAGETGVRDDLILAAKVNQKLSAMMETSSFDFVKNRVIFMDGSRYTGGQMLSAADAHAERVDLMDYAARLADDRSLDKDIIMDRYYASSPRMPDGAAPWIADLKVSDSERNRAVNTAETIAVVLEWMNQGIPVNLNRSIFDGPPPAAGGSTSSGSRRDKDRSLLWNTLRAYTQGQLLELEMNAETNASVSDNPTALIVEDGSAIRMIFAADTEGERQKIEVDLKHFDPETMRLMRFDREGRLYEQRYSKRPAFVYAISPGDILLISLDKEMKK